MADDEGAGVSDAQYMVDAMRLFVYDILSVFIQYDYFLGLRCLIEFM